jgi:hypothetical protein
VTTREPFFECVLVCDRNEYRFHFRAWSAEQAELHLREELLEAGARERGEVQVFDTKGRLLRRGAFPGRKAH